MNVYLFGNPDVDSDSRPFTCLTQLKADFPNVDFLPVFPNSDLPETEDLILIDTVAGISQVTLFTQEDLGKISLSPRNSAHDYDLGFQLKYLVKLHKLRNIRIIGIPANQKFNYSSLQSILRKLVAQDMQGS